MDRPLRLPLAATALALGLVGGTPAGADELPALVDWGQRYQVSSPLAGVVREVSAIPGVRVEAGQLLFTLDTRRLQADLRAAEAERERVRLELAEADREVERAEELYDRTLIAVREVELARILRAMAAARLAKAEADLRRTRIDLDDSEVRSPAAARVLTVHVTAGDAVSPALAPPVLATLGGVDPMRADTTVDAGTAARLQPGQPASVQVGGETLPATVASIGWEPEDIGFGPGYRVGVAFSPPGRAEFRAGQEARVRFGAQE
jgi:RND family efflux transporter MFP subunit